jgi:signal transduction histidine kinase
MAAAPLSCGGLRSPPQGRRHLAAVGGRPRHSLDNPLVTVRTHNARVDFGGQAPNRLERLQALTDAALAHLNLDDLFATLLLRAREVLSVDTCAVLLLDEDTGELVARAAVGIEEEVEQGVRIPVGRGFAGTIASTRKPVVLPDVDHADVLNPLLREKGIKSMLGVPLIAGDTVVGVIHVGTLHHHTFSQEDIELLQLAADRAAIAIEHARAFEAEQRTRKRIENVQAVTDVALAHLELDDLLEVILPRIRSILATDTCAVLLLDRAADELVARAALGIEEEVEQGVRIPLGRGFAGRVAATREPVILDDVDTANVWNPILREKGIKSMLGVPLLVGNDAIGVLHVGTLVHRKFRVDDVELLQLVAARVAIAIERARLHEEMVQLDQLKLNFVAVASHELRTPATSVYGVLTTLATRGDDLSPELRAELLRVGCEQGERLRRLLEELLDLSRLDASSIRLQPRLLELDEAISVIVREALPTDAAVELELEPGLRALADPLALDRVLSNLLTNAVRYGRPPLRVITRGHGDRVDVVVEDAGEGVPEHLRPHLFERFTRGDETSGTGLGLAIARAYANAQGGDLVYIPTEGGARFALSLLSGGEAVQQTGSSSPVSTS